MSDGPTTESEVHSIHCPSCSAELSPDAVFCVACGYDFKDGKHLATIVEPAAAQFRAPKPIEPESPPESLRDQEMTADKRMEWLEERVRELERRVDGTKLVSTSFFDRMLAVCGYLFLAYITMVIVVFFFRLIFGI